MKISGHCYESSPLDKAVYLVLKRFRNQNNEDPTGVYFNKVLSILHQRLRSTFDLKLPHCWYRWGDEVVRRCLPHDVNWDHDYLRTTVSWDGLELHVEIEDHLELINEEIEKIIDTFPMSNIDRIVSEVYSYAPFDFQRSFRNIRGSLGFTNEIDICFENIHLDNIKKQKSIAESDFKSVDYNIPILHSSFRLWSESFDFLVNESKVDYETLININESFWFHFCYYLRLKQNENVPIDVIDHWKNLLPYDVKNRNNEIIHEVKKIIITGFEPSEEVSAIIKKRDDEINELISINDDLYDGEDTIDELKDRKYSYHSKIR